ncbi:MAG TPA: aldo/keto reductase [Acidothermaceae bacterium]|nr:aldo/keto reductase [Acidothermaceae bacterium]
MPHSPSPALRLNDGTQMPQLGLGTYGLNGRRGTEAVIAATDIGYRLFDTAVRYGNEAAVAAGIDAASVSREELFVTTKFDGEFQGGRRALRGLDDSLRRMGLDYVDLILIHWPLPRRDLYIDTWKTFEQLLATGKTKSIGVSNFKPAHLDRLQSDTSIVPAVNQIELDPTLARVDARAYHEVHGIVTQAYSPLGGSSSPVVRNPTLIEIARAHGRTPAQIALRWCIEIGVSTVPKSGNVERLAENIGIFDFALTADDMAHIAALDQGESAAQDSDHIGH